MSEFQLSTGKIRKGVWSGFLTGGTSTPKIEVLFRDTPVPDVFVQEADGGWTVKVPIPADAIAEGVQTFAIFDKASGTTLGDFTLIAGEAMGDDIRAEIELLRAELDMLKRAFRRHCVETT